MSLRNAQCKDKDANLYYVASQKYGDLVSFFFFLKKIDLLLWDVQMFTWIFIKTVLDTSLYETCGLI